MRSRLIGLLITAVVCVASGAESRFAQSVPVPEYFGVYAVVDGKLLKLDGQEVHAEKFATVRIGQRLGVGNVVQHQPATMPPKNMQVPELPADLKIIIYAQESGGLESPLDIAKTLHLESLVFIRTLTIDTGWPSAIKRSDPEDGWDAGDAVEVGVVSGGEHARELEFLMKPMPGQKGMLVAGLADKLSPGVYRLTLGQRDAFMPASLQGGMLFAVQPVPQGETEKCIDALISYNMSMSSAKYTPCGGSSGTAAQPIGNPRATMVASSNAIAACNDYDSCFQAGIAAYKSKDWGGAKTAFQAAANQRPTSGEPWMWLGRILFQDNQPHQLSDVSDVWDKALSLGTELMLGGCHERSFQPCQRGDLALSTRRISFLANGSQPVFSAAPADVTPGHILNNSAGAHISYSMRVANKNYAIDFIPLGTVCQFNLMVQCPQDGITKQLIVAQYVSEVLPKLARGALAARGSPVSAANPTSTISAANSACNQAADAGYAILLQGHLYKVRWAGLPAPNHKLFFFDEKGNQVVDVSLLMQLAAAVWTHDNIIASPDARNASSRVSGILGTSKALQTYTAVQDLIARTMVEATEAGLTGGASLTKAVPNLTVSVLKGQLLNAPKTLLTLSAQHGLEASLAAYQQMEAVPLPSQDATAFNATDLARIRNLYMQGRSLELPYAALAAKLMPTSGSDLTQQALRSAFTELTTGPLFSSAPSTAVTLQSLFKLQQSVADLAGSLPALQAYSQDLKLAINLTAANDETISKWAAAAAGHGCT